jgi:hypothetical protein
MGQMTGSGPSRPENGDAKYSLKGYKPKFTEDLIRVGRDFDGGYLINERAIRQAQYLLSFGVSDDWSFEEDFLNRKADVKVLCFDNSVSKEIFRSQIFDALNQILSVRFVLGALTLNFRAVRNRLFALKRSIRTYFDFRRFFARENARFFAKGISSEKSDSFFTMSEVFNLISREKLKENSIFIKMDIERSEFRVLADLLSNQEHVSGLVVEFHDLDILWTNFVELMNRLKEHFEVTHIHGNNYCGLIPTTTTPKFLEITFLKKSLLKEEHPDGGTPTYPIPGLDQPNNPQEKDYPLYF